MSILIHNRQYITVAERVESIHRDLVKEGFSITTEVLYQMPVVIKATVITKKGTFTGISAANPDKIIEKMSPYEVAETSAVGRALGFAGYGIAEGIATADEIKKADPTDAWQKGNYDLKEETKMAEYNPDLKPRFQENAPPARKSGYTDNKNVVTADTFENDNTCPMHNVKMKERIGKTGAKWFDHRQQLESGTWQKCSGKGWK